MKIHNFSAGPSMLPEEVLKKCSKSILNYNESKLSILEISHRSEEFFNLYKNTINKVKKLMGLDNNYEILLLQGGASLQFIMVPYNLIKKKSAYLDTGIWSSLAIKEAKKFGRVDIIASSKNYKYNRIPKFSTNLKNYDYFHITTNNTIFGTQIQDFSQFDNTILVADMSSDIFSRNINFKKFDLIYASAQKNIGPAGVVLVIIKKSLLELCNKKIPSYLNYNVHVNKNGIFNTPNVFAIYAIYETLTWLENIGGISKIEKINNLKSKLIYDEIDRNKCFFGHSMVEFRSNMNATFFMKKGIKEKKFNFLLKKNNISGLYGHRLIGGYRASIYNAMPISSIKLLVEIMKEFERIS